MPTYQYKCDECIVEAEQTSAIDNQITPDCPVCGNAMLKVFQATPAIFRGTGWGRG